MQKKRKMDANDNGNSLKGYAKKRLLEDMINGAKEASKARKKPAREFIFVIENETLKIVNKLLKMTDLTSNGIFGVEKLELQRKPFPVFQAIYFIKATKENFDLIEQDAENSLYRYFHVYTCSEIDQEVMSYLGTKKKLIQKLLTLKELNIDFQTVDDCTFTLGMPNMLNSLYYDMDAKAGILTTTAKRLYCALSVLMPCSSLEVTFQRSDNCQMVAGVLLDKFQKAIKNKESPLDEQSGTIKVLLLERSYDPVTPLMHDFYYQSLLADLLAIDHTEQVSFKVTSAKGESNTAKAYLDETDSIWKEYRYSHIAAALTGVTKKFKEMTDQSAAAKIQRGNQIEDMNLDKMQQIVRDMPEYTLMLNKYTLHMSLLQRVMQNISDKQLKEIGEMEQLLSTGVTGSGDKPSSSKIFKQFLQLMSTSPAMEENQRLRMCLLVYSNLLLNSSSKEKVKALIKSERDKRALLNLSYLGVDLADASKATKNKVSDSQKAAAKKKLKKEEFDLCHYISPLEEILDSYIKGKLDRNNFNSLLAPKGAKQKNFLPTNLTAFRTHSVSKGKKTARSKTVLFVIGGLSYPEIRILKGRGKLTFPNFLREKGSTQRKHRRGRRD